MLSVSFQKDVALKRRKNRNGNSLLPPLSRQHVIFLLSVLSENAAFGLAYSKGGFGEFDLSSV